MFFGFNKSLSAHVCAASALAGAGFISSAFITEVCAQATLARIASNSRVNVGFRDDAMPFSFIGNDNKPTGYALDYCNAVVEKIRRQPGMSHVTANYVHVPIDRVINYVRDGHVDLMCSSTSDTAARRKQIAFSKPIYFTGVRILVNTSKIDSLSQLKGQTVGVINASTAALALEKYSDGNGMDWKVPKLLNGDVGISQLQLGWLGGFARDDIPLMVQMLRLASPGDYKILPERFSVETLAIAFRKDDPAMQSLVDHVIAESASNGSAAAMYDRWFMQPLPGLKQALNVPMSDELRLSLASVPTAVPPESKSSTAHPAGPRKK